ncbi:tRNA (N(6)-L-threonylcarbamoyladenosine(37)-C(2))-methylthiotransferase MtaB [bacterium]|nr:MAG: tRNA (N(6)-L-threonylcarbamoyladenosine(37)-C(2))-methylthiotransferase MtaB [bacterium]
MAEKTLLVHTMGCKVNQYESMHLKEALDLRGFSPASEDSNPEVIIVNTCTVTQRSDRNARILIRRARRSNPEAFLVVTGCLAQTSGEEMLSLGADLVAGSAWKQKLPELIEKRQRGVLAGTSYPLGLGPEPVKRFDAHTRAFFKVQDGCETFCAYCIVPHARGPSRSLPPEEVKNGLITLKEGGHREVVLTGIHIGNWGKDLNPPKNFMDLLDLAEAHGPERIRISSLEPLELTGEVTERIATSRVLCPHLHIPLQSGSDGVLKRMGRPYDAGLFLDRVMNAARRIDDLCLGFDVIAGFPGESEEDFCATKALLQKIPFCYLHIFPYSPRKSTPAYGMAGQVEEGEKRRRAAALKELSAQKRGEFERSQLGKVHPALGEGKVEEGFLTFRTRNYLEVRVKWEGEKPPGELGVKITGRSGKNLMGEISCR